VKPCHFDQIHLEIRLVCKPRVIQRGYQTCGCTVPLILIMPRRLSLSNLLTSENPFDCNDMTGTRPEKKNIGNREINVVGVHWNLGTNRVCHRSREERAYVCAAASNLLLCHNPWIFISPACFLFFFLFGYLIIFSQAFFPSKQPWQS
jgi:hypothetical protein